jgi:S-adenosylmethionine-diacylgycerolhomoserine-N-methlytransferase
LRALPTPEAGGADRFGLDTLARFYRFHARIYDWTRPFILFGRRRLVEGLRVERGMRVLDVGCGTGHNLPALARVGADVTGIEPSPAMLREVRQRVARLQLRTALDERPYGSHQAWRGAADRIVFSYSLSMIPPWRDALESARRDLRAGGRIGVVDFLDAGDRLTQVGLSSSHVFLGGERLSALRQMFPRHVAEVRRGLSWRYFLFWGEAG